VGKARGCGSAGTRCNPGGGQLVLAGGAGSAWRVIASAWGNRPFAVSFLYEVSVECNRARVEQSGPNNPELSRMELRGLDQAGAMLGVVRSAGFGRVCFVFQGRTRTPGQPGATSARALAAGPTAPPPRGAFGAPGRPGSRIAPTNLRRPQSRLPRRRVGTPPHDIDSNVGGPRRIPGRRMHGPSERRLETGSLEREPSADVLEGTSRPGRARATS